MDIGKIGLIATAAAVFLAIPLSVVANLLTPRVQSWYGTTSQTRLRKRLRKLEVELLISEQGWTFTPSEWAAYKTGCMWSLGLTLGLAGLFYFLLGTLQAIELGLRSLGGPPALHTQLGKRIILEPSISLIVGGVGLTVMLVLSARQFQTFRMNRAMHSEEGREEIRQEIKKLISLGTR
jgi:hypothetical protein